MAIDKTLIDHLLADYKEPEDIIGENGLLKQLTKAILERALQAELTDHLGFEKHDPAGHHSGNSRNGSGRKALKGDFGELELETPRNRQASFEPKIVRFCSASSITPGRFLRRWMGAAAKVMARSSKNPRISLIKCRATLHQSLPDADAMHGLHIQLLLGLDLHKPHILFRDRFGDGFGIDEVVLV
jgi:hypothetical protein